MLSRIPPAGDVMPKSESSLFANAVPVFMKSFGTLHQDKTVYVIWRERAAAGLFSQVFHVLCHLNYARELGLTPVVDMEHFPTLYNEAGSVQAHAMPGNIISRNPRPCRWRTSIKASV